MEQDSFDIDYEGTLLLEDSEVFGDIRSDKNVCLKGIVRGDIDCRTRLTIDMGAVVDGNVVCKELVTDGLITGNVSVARSVLMGAHAEIRGGLITGCLKINPAAKIKGGLRLSKYRVKE